MTEKMKRFEFLEHTADIYIVAYGRNLAESFENAALAMFEVMTDTDSVNPKTEQKIEAEGHDKQALFYSWLENLLVKFELDGMLYSRFKIEKIDKTEEGLKFEATIWGEPFKVERHKQKVGVKAVTYHRMEINETFEKVTSKFILDI